jgi:uncharacterized protein (UPF0548 family)
VSGPSFLFQRPDEAAMRAFLVGQRGSRSTYDMLTPNERARLFVVDRSAAVGRADELERAVAALERWAQYPAPWTTVISEHTPPVVGDVTCARLRHLGFWSLVACRVTRVERSDRSFEIEIETLEGHAEVGTETFSLSAVDGELVYRITSRSGPGHLLTRLGEPVMRHYQERFLRESPDALRAAIRGR